MEKYNLNFNHISRFLFIISLSLCTFSANSAEINSENPIQDLVCGLINCGQGKCVASNETLLGFHCDCNAGWKKIQIGPLTFPSCILPNCTLNLQCGNVVPPPPPTPSPAQPFNISNPCNLIWCGDGLCVANGTNHICQCYAGAANLFASRANACLNECSLGADCKGLGVGVVHSPPPPTIGTITTPTRGSNGVPTGSTNFIAITTIILATTFVSLI